MIDLEAKEGQEITKYFSREVNNLFFKPDKIAEIPFVKREMESVSNGKMEKVAKEMALEHRTLQQTFSGLVFFHFLQSCNKEESEKLIAVMGDSFYRLPLT